MLAEQPFHLQELLPALPGITPTSPEFMKIDLDAGLNDTDRKNLEDMELDIPSLVSKNKTIEETQEKLKQKIEELVKN